MDLDEWIQQHIYFLGTYDTKGISFLKKFLGKGDTFIDIGANIGSFSLIAAECVGESGKVYAFEPISQVYERLKYNIKINHLDNVILNKYAVHDKNETLKFFVSDRQNLGMSSIFHHDTESGKVETVEAIIFDDYAKEKMLDKIKLIKIDIEGAELHALRGMKDTLRKTKPVVLMEIAENVLENSRFTAEEIFSFMSELAYSPKVLTVDGDIKDPAESPEPYHTNYVFLPV